MSKDRSFSEIAAAIQLLNKDVGVLDVKAADNMNADILPSDNASGNGISELNPGEMDVIRLATRGMSNKDIASTLIVSEGTVQTHLVNIYKKLKVNSRTQAIIAGLRLGWLTIDDLTYSIFIKGQISYYWWTELLFYPDSNPYLSVYF